MLVSFAIVCLFLCLCGILLTEKLTIWIFRPKQPGFVRVCKSCKEEAPVGETFWHAIWGSKSKCVLTVNQNFCFILCQLSNHQFEELAMDVYDEVDRRETDAGETTYYISIYNAVCNVILFMPAFYCFIFMLCFFSVVGHSEPQYTCNRHHSCAFSACQSRVLLYQKPGKCLHQCCLLFKIKFFV